MTRREQNECIAELYTERDETMRLIVCLRQRARKLLEQLNAPSTGVQDASETLAKYADQGRDPEDDYGHRRVPQFRFASCEEASQLVTEIQDAEERLVKTKAAIRNAGGHP